MQISAIEAKISAAESSDVISVMNTVLEAAAEHSWNNVLIHFFRHDLKLL